LPLTAHRIAWFAVTLNLPDVRRIAFQRLICRRAATHIVAAVPLKPTAWIVRVNPSVLAPGGQGLARMDAKVIERTVAAGVSELRPREPTIGELAPNISHVLAVEHTELQHLFGRQPWMELRIKVSASSLNKLIAIPACILSFTVTVRFFISRIAHPFASSIC
jgi:hypothetical protein